MTYSNEPHAPWDDDAAARFADQFATWAETLSSEEQELLGLIVDRAGEALGVVEGTAPYGVGSSLRIGIMAVILAANTAGAAGLTAPQRAAADVSPPSLGQLPPKQGLPDVVGAIDAPAVVGAGEQFEYVVKLRNIGGSPASEATVDVTLPVGVSFVPARRFPTDSVLNPLPGPSHFSCSADGQVVHCVMAAGQTLPPQSLLSELTGAVEIPFSVRAPMQAGSITVMAVVNPGANSIAGATTKVVQRPDVGVALAGPVPLHQGIGQVLSYDFFLFNNSDNPAQNFSASFDILNAAGVITTFSNISGGGITCSMTADGFHGNCSSSTLAPHASARIQVLVRATTPDFHFLQAIIRANADNEAQSTMGDNTVQFQVPVG